MARLAIVGLGNWGKKLLESFSKHSEIITCCTTGNKKNIAWLNKNFPSVKYTSDINKVIQDPKIDAIAIATPIVTHYEFAKKALALDKHVFMEKPLSTNEQQVKELFKIAREKKIALFTGNIFAYSETFKFLEKENAKKSFDYIQWNWEKFGTFNENIFWNLAWHYVFMTIKLMGVPLETKLISHRGLKTENDLAVVRLTFINNKKCLMSINRVAGKARNTATFLSKEALFFWDKNAVYRLDRYSEEFNEVFLSVKKPLETECEQFISLLSNKKTCPDDEKIILETIKVIRNLIEQSHAR